MLIDMKQICKDYPQGHDVVRVLRDVDLQMALQKLPEKFRLPILLHHMNGLSVPEIARMLRLPQTTVKGRIREGLKKLRMLLEEEET